MSITLLLSLYFLTILLVLTHQMIQFESSSPDARKAPLGETAIALTQVVWKLKSIETYVGNGFKSFGEGSSGINLLGSLTFTFFLNKRGHMYKSKQRSKCSFIKFSKSGTFLKASNFWGIKVVYRSSSSASCHSFFSYSSNKNSSGGLND